MIKTTTAIVGALVLAASAAQSATHVQVDYSGALGSASNIRAPFNASGSGFTPSLAFSGSFVYDPGLVPTTGLINVPFSTLTHPSATAAQTFSLNFGPLTFARDSHLSSLLANPGVQFSNGQFNGFVFVSNFNWTNGSTYQLRFNGPTVTVRLVDPVSGFATGSSLINARVTTGAAGLTNSRPFPPASAPIPEPAIWASMIMGLGAVGAALRTRRRLVKAL